jgi:hypothetical protein
MKLSPVCFVIHRLLFFLYYHMAKIVATEIVIIPYIIAHLRSSIMKHVSLDEKHEILIVTSIKYMRCKY